MIEYNDRMIYDWFNNPFPDDFSSSDLNPHTIPIYDSPLPDKISEYTPDLSLSDISVAPESFLCILITPYDYSQVLVLNYDYPNHHHEMNKDNPVHVRLKRVYFSSRPDGEI